MKLIAMLAIMSTKFWSETSVISLRIRLCHMKQPRDFMWNDLTGTIPKEIGNISSLILLLLNGNKLSGSLPDGLGYLSNLNRLQVDQNNITGTIPISRLSTQMLTSIYRGVYFSSTHFNCLYPSELSKLSTLNHLQDFVALITMLLFWMLSILNLVCKCQ